MGWWERAKRALFGDGGNHGYQRLHKTNSSADDRPVEPADVPCPFHQFHFAVARLLHHITHVVSTEAAVTIDVPELPLRELKQATRSFSGSRLIGQGHHTKVYRASLRSGRLAAAKVLERPHCGSWQWHQSDVGFLKQQLTSVLSVASRLQHENLVRLLGYTITGDLRVLLHEFAAMGTLHDVLHGLRREALSWAQRARVALDAARGLAHLHVQGHARQIDDATVHGSGYRCATMGRRTRKCDVFSFGVVLLELLMGRTPLAPGRRQPSLVEWATPRLTEGRVEECIHPKLLGAQYPRAGALKLGRIAVQCLQHDHTSRSSMGTVARMISDDVVRDLQHGDGAVVAG